MKWQRVLWNIFKWAALIAYMVAGLSFVTHRNREVVCSRIRVRVVDSLENSFVRSRDIVRMIDRKGHSPIGRPLCTINTHELERELASLMAVRDVQAYKTLDGELRVRVKQRRPIVRVFNRSNQSYYIDDMGLIQPLSERYSAHVLVVNGNIVEPFRPKANVNVLAWRDSLQNGIRPVIYQLYEFARYVSADDFWNAQIAQVYIDGPNDVELIPRVGPHVVQLGGFVNFESKLKKLKKFYEKALPTEGWNKYSMINLKYANQIICTKR
jgi:cell division protein FtsQ